jgi:hypothetical protein
MTDDDDARASVTGGDTEYPHEGSAYGMGKVGIELVGEDAPDVIGLDDLVE